MRNIYMFKSATIRLTSWYLLILMLISLIFSISIYQMAGSEVRDRLEHFQINLQDSRNEFLLPVKFENIRNQEIINAKANLAIQLLYVNLFILSIGGFVSYFLARKSLRPIEKAHEAETQFTSDASHELRTPLAVIKTEIEVALKNPQPNLELFQDILKSNLEEVEKLSQLSEMLLNLSRLDNTKLSLKPINLFSITNEIIASFKLEQKRIIYKSHKKLIIKGNDSAIKDLIKVLIENAIQYSPLNSKIHIASEKLDRFVKFEITNNGQGISADKLPHIFDRFYRADSSRTYGGKKGYGLGLSLAQRIVQLHNGKISATSNASETKFIILLPIEKS